MGKVLILTGSFNESRQKFADYLKTALNKKAQIILGKFSDLDIDFGEDRIEVTHDGKNIKNFDLIYIRHVGHDNYQLASTLAICLEFLKIKYFDTAFGNLGPAGNKLTSLMKLVTDGVPIMSSYYTDPGKIELKRAEIIKRIGLPMVAKELSSQRGEGVYLLKTEKDFDRFKQLKENNHYIFQKYFPNSREYRILVYGYRPAVVYEKIRTDPNEFRNNTALGALEKYFDISEASFEMKKISVQVAKTLMLEITGVDFLVDQRGKIWVLEANRGPGFTHNTNISPELPELAKFLAEQLGYKNN